MSNILWKKVGRGELTRDEAERIASDVRQADVTIHPMGLLFGRAPAPSELRLGLEFVKEAPWEQYAQVLLATGEFAVID